MRDREHSLITRDSIAFARPRQSFAVSSVRIKGPYLWSNSFSTSTSTLRNTRGYRDKDVHGGFDGRVMRNECTTNWVACFVRGCGLEGLGFLSDFARSRRDLIFRMWFR